MLKHCLSNSEILWAPRPVKKKKVLTDASAYGLEGMFLRANDEGWRPVAFNRKQLKKAELLYAVHEKECFAVVHSLKKRRHYLHGEELIIVTDQLSLRPILSLQDP